MEVATKRKILISKKKDFSSLQDYNENLKPVEQEETFFPIISQVFNQ